MEKVSGRYYGSNSVVESVILVTIQVLMAISVVTMLEIILFQGLNIRESNMAPLFGIVTAAALLLLCKYQNMIKEFSQRTDTLRRLVNERTLDLQKANEGMEQEIKERKRAQQRLLEGETRFRTIIQEAAIGMAVVDKQGRLMQSNLALQRMLDYTPEKLQDMVIAQLIHPGDVAGSMKSFQELLKGTQPTYRIEERFLRLDGTVVWGRLSISLVRDAAADPLFVIVMVEDISKRREAEEKVRNYQKHLQSLASELSLTEERERRRLATDLHDHIGQALAVSKIKLGVLQKIVNSPDISNPLAEVRELIDQMIQETRSLTFKLSLPVLYELGFEAAVDWLAKNMHQQHGIQIQVQRHGQSAVLNTEVSALLFQMVRELLFNIVKHAQATMAKVAIQKVGNQLQVEVADNGVGFDPAKNDPKMYKVDGFGLFSIRERLNYFAGGLEIESAPGHGSRISMTIPMN